MGSPYNVFGETLDDTTPVYLTTAFLNEPVPNARYETTFYRAVNGLKGQITSRYSWESAFNYSLYKTNNSFINYPNSEVLPQAILGGYDGAGNVVAPGTPYPTAGPTPGPYSLVQSRSGLVLQPTLDPFALNPDPASLANVFDHFTQEITTKQRIIDGKIIAFPFDLKAGPIGLALGGEYREEFLTFLGGLSPLTYAGNQDPPIFSRRTVKAVYAEANAPLVSTDMNVPGIRTLVVGAGLRFEQFSDAGATVVPKATIIWRPIDNLAVRERSQTAL